MKVKTLLPFLFLFSSSLLFSQSSDFIHVDQFGYYENAEKVAVISDPQVGFNSSNSFTPSATLELRNADTDAVVFSAPPTVWNNGATQSTSGDRGWWFDFSTVTSPGTYYIYDVGSDEKSAEFDINNNVYTEVLKTAGRAFFYNRCGHAKNAPYAETGWTDGVSFTQDETCRYIYDPNNTTLEKELSGGWFDAGDYNKYTTFAGPTIHDLLWAYQENNNAFTDNWNIPESGNGIPDIIDEIKWELDWLQKMVNTDGSTIIKMGSQNYAENVNAPPSNNNDTRFYGPTCTSASISAASTLAHAAKVLGNFSSLSSYAQTLEDKAIAAWDYALPFIENNTLETDCDDGSIVAGDADRDAAAQIEEALGAAVYLFDLTGEAAYSEFVRDYIDQASFLSTDDWSGDKIDLADPLLLYTTLSGADGPTVSDILNSATTSATNNWNNYYEFSGLDLYRAFTPDWTFHWGSNKVKAHYGVLNNILLKYNINPSSNAAYEQKVAEQIHYFHGVNPLGLVYMSNMNGLGAEKSCDEIYHTWFDDGNALWDNAQSSTYGPAPGFVPGGPNEYFNGNASLSPPNGQPAQKSYLDWNTTSDASWEITEPAIYYQAAFVRLLAAVTPDIPLPVEWIGNPRATLVKGDVQIDWFTSTELQNEKFEIEHSLDGKSFFRLGTQKGNHNSTLTNSYRFLHRDAPVGMNYYRIKQIDFDGRFEYSSIASVMVEKRTPLTVFPNPVKDQIFLQGEAANYQVRVFDGNGLVVLEFEFRGDAEQFDVSELVDGVYVVQVLDLDSGVVEVVRFLKI